MKDAAIFLLLMLLALAVATADRDPRAEIEDVTAAKVAAAVCLPPARPLKPRKRLKGDAMRGDIA